MRLRLVILSLIGSALTSSCGDDASFDPNLREVPPSRLAPLFERCPDLVDGCGELDANAYAPEDYDRRTRYPLVILLHGFSASGPAQNLYLGLSRMVTREQFILLTPSGTFNSDETRFWNATESCCNAEGLARDDEGYLLALIDEAEANFNIDPGRVYLFGHSNGGYMSYRMACRASDRITAIASLAGATYADPADCPAEEPVSVLQIHGTEDPQVLYEGGSFGTDGREYPGALESVQRFAGRAGCNLERGEMLPNVDVELGIEGDETTVLRYERGCARGVNAELWTIVDGGHLPAPSPTFSESVIRWLLSHEK